MKLLFTYLVMALIIGLIVFAVKSEPKPDPVIKEMAEEMFNKELTKRYILKCDTIDSIRMSNIKYLPVAIHCNANH